MKVTDEHIYLLGAYISVLSSEYYLSNLRTNKGFVRQFKQKTNHYIDYLQNEVYRTFKTTYEIDEEKMDDLFLKMKKRNSFQADEFLKDMCK